MSGGHKDYCFLATKVLLIVVHSLTLVAVVLALVGTGALLTIHEAEFQRMMDITKDRKHYYHDSLQRDAHDAFRKVKMYTVPMFVAFLIELVFNLVSMVGVIREKISLIVSKIIFDLVVCVLYFAIAPVTYPIFFVFAEIVVIGLMIAYICMIKERQNSAKRSEMAAVYSVTGSATGLSTIVQMPDVTTDQAIDRVCQVSGGQLAAAIGHVIPELTTGHVVKELTSGHVIQELAASPKHRGEKRPLSALRRGGSVQGKATPPPPPPEPSSGSSTQC